MYEPDPELIRAASAGNTAAFEELVRAYQAHKWRFLRHLPGDQDLAQDITKGTFVRVYRKLGTFRFRSKFSTWVFQVARNAGIDALRSRQRQERLLTALEPRAPEVTLGGELRMEIEEALQTLGPKLREAFVLIEAFGFTYREAGRTIGVPEGTVKSRVYHAREQLLSWMIAEEGAVDEA